MYEMQASYFDAELDERAGQKSKPVIQIFCFGNAMVNFSKNSYVVQGDS
jgi:hypothetical protein